MTKFRRSALAVVVLGMVGTNLAQMGVASAAPAARAKTLTCGAVVTQDTTLAADVGPCPGDGLTIGAGHVTLNLNRHQVFGHLNSFGTGASTDSTGIHFNNVKSSTVTNGEVFDFAAGVRIDGGSGNTVTRLYDHDNISPIGGNNNGDGIAIWNSSYNTISQNIVNHNGQYSGISLVTGPYSATNGVVNPAMSGTGNKVLNNDVTNNNVSLCSRHVSGQPAPCMPAGTTGSFPYGSQIPGSVDAGIRVEGPNMTNTDVERNKVSDAGTNGIWVDPSCHDAFLVPMAQVTCTGDVGNIHTLIKNNVSNHNGYGRTTGFGINLFGMGVSKAVQGSHDTVVNNTTEYNRDGGIILYSSSCNDYPSNDPRQCAATDDKVLNNLSSFNGLSLGVNNSQGDGIEMSAGANRNTVSHNVVNGNDSDGIGVEMAQQYDANGNPVVDANGKPVYIPGSGASYNVLSANHGTGNHYLDGEDQNPGCGTNDWDLSAFITVNQPCVLDSDQPGDGGGHVTRTHATVKAPQDATPISRQQGDPSNN